MGPSPFLKNQETPFKKSFSLRAFFNLFFVISLGVNIYFFFFQGRSTLEAHVYATGLEEAKSLRKQTVELDKEFVNSRPMTVIHEQNPIQRSNPVEKNSYEAKQVSFSSSTQPTESNIQALKLTIKNYE